MTVFVYNVLKLILFLIPPAASTENVIGASSKQEQCWYLFNQPDKKYSDYTAVNNLCLNFCKGEITTLLGQNGAGKTTTL